MNKHTVIYKFVLMSLVFCSLTANAQTYYNMWRGSGQSGRPEWIANSAMTYGFSGIQFTTADRICGYANAYGRWMFVDPNESVTTSQHINILNTNLNAMPHVAAATTGYMAASRFIVTDLEFTSGVDSFWGYGRGNEMTISNQMSSLFRLNSYGGIGFWGNGLAMDNDTPNLKITGSEITSSLTGISTTVKNNGTVLWTGTTSNTGIEIGTNNTTALYIGNGQNFFIGFTKATASAISDQLKTKYRLFVEKGILSEDYAIAPKAAWSDFVFNPEYELKDLHAVESYIEANNHLPDVPSAEEIAKDGYLQHDINMTLLQKIEELTLYVIQQQKEIEELKSMLESK